MACNPKDCPDKYVEFISSGMLVCNELTQTTSTTGTANLFGIAEYQCEYAKCKRVLFADPDVWDECPEYPFDDIDDCNRGAGDAVLNQDKMFIEFDGIFY